MGILSEASRHCEILVLGAGLCGLAAALTLTEEGCSVKVLEAHQEPGGRIKSLRDSKSNSVLADLGPTWIWPDYQPTAKRWVKKLGLCWQEQFTDGIALFDDDSKRQARRVNLPGQMGIMRLDGGTQTLIGALLEALPKSTVELGFPVRNVTYCQETGLFTVTDTQGRKRASERLISAIPPRVVANVVTWSPPLSDNLLDDLHNTPTWMSSQAKAVIRYPQPFWKELGLSGRIASRVGPIVEAHDHCSADGESACLFGFVGWPAKVRAELGEELESEIRAQMRRCFGPEAPEPTEVLVKDWALDPYVCRQRDLDEEAFHPEVRPRSLREAYSDGRLIFAGAETSEVSPGLIEGALNAAERAASQLT